MRKAFPHRIRLTRALANRSPDRPPTSNRFQRSGSQMVRLPTINSSASSIVTTSSTCVTPPVGSGSAGTAISTMKTTANAFSPNTSVRLPSVFGSSCWNHRSSRSLTFLSVESLAVRVSIVLSIIYRRDRGDLPATQAPLASCARMATRTRGNRGCVLARDWPCLVVRADQAARSVATGIRMGVGR